MNYIVIILAVFVILLLYFLYKSVFNKSLVKGLIRLDAEKTLSTEVLSNPRSNKYYYEFWTFINNAPSTITPIVRRMGDLSIYLDQSNNLILTKDTAPTPLFTIINPYPLQKWVHVIVHVNNHGDTGITTIECYINGKLVMTKPNQRLTSVPSGDLLIGMSSGLNGYITRLKRVPENIDANTAWNHYVAGNGISGIARFFSQYNIDMNVKKDQVLQRRVRLI